MNDYWNDPPDDTEPPECCEELMEVESTGACVCSTCGKRIEPPADIDPSAFADVELPDGYLRTTEEQAHSGFFQGNSEENPNKTGLK